MLLRLFATDDSAPVRLGPADEAARAAARELDEALGDVDWTAPIPGAEGGFFPAPSGELAMVAAGEGDRVVLLPGVTGSKEDFALMIPPLAAAGHRVESYDLAGQYESWRAGPAEGRYDYPLFLADLVAILESGGPAHLLGYSFAGVLGQLVVAERPELVRSLTLLASPPTPGNGFSSMKLLGPVSGLVPDSVGAALMLWGIQSNQNEVPRNRYDFVMSRFALTRRESVSDLVGLMKRIPDVRAAVRAAPIPKLVAVGAHDLWPAERQAELAEALGAELAVYPTGHSPCETTPHQLVADMLALWG